MTEPPHEEETTSRGDSVPRTKDARRETWNSRLRELESDVMSELKQGELTNRLALEKIRREAAAESERMKNDLTGLATKVSELIRAALLDEPEPTPVSAPLLMHDKFKELIGRKTAEQWQFASDEDLETYTRLAAPLTEGETDEEWLVRRRELEEFLSQVTLARVKDVKDTPPHLVVASAETDEVVAELSRRKGKTSERRLLEAGLMDAIADNEGRDRPSSSRTASGNVSMTGQQPKRDAPQDTARGVTTAAGGMPGGGGSDDEDDDDPRRPTGPSGPPIGIPPTGRRRHPAEPRHPAAHPMFGVNARAQPSISVGRPPITVAMRPLGITAALQANAQELLWIDDFVQQYVSVDPDTLPNLSKQVKIAQPEAYRGQDSTDAFEVWLITVLRWLRFSRVTGPALDEERVHLLGLVLSGPAAEWYNQEVSSPYRVAPNWTFLDVLYALHARFVHRATAQEATEQYESVKFSRSGGVAAYYGERRKWAACMVEHPDAYAFRRSFLMGLPTDIVRPMLESMGLSAETSTIEQLLQGALHVENSQKFIAGYQRNSRNAVTATSNPAVPRPTATRHIRAGGAVRPRTDLRGGTAPPRIGTAPVSAPSASTGPRPAAPGARGGVAEKGKTVDKSKVQCFACGGMGHYSTESVCPKARQPSFRRMEVVSEGGSPAEVEQQDATAADDEESSSPPVEGSQYEPDEDSEHALDQYEDFDYEEHETGESEQYFGSMRLVPFVDEVVPENVLADELAQWRGELEETSSSSEDDSDHDRMPPLELVNAPPTRTFTGPELGLRDHQCL